MDGWISKSVWLRVTIYGNRKHIRSFFSAQELRRLQPEILNVQRLRQILRT